MQEYIQTQQYCNMKVFLDGTACSAQWQNYICERLKINYILYTNDDRSEETLRKRDKDKEQCDFVLYIVSPKMQHFDMIFESVDDSNKRPKKTIFCFVPSDEDLSFTNHQNKSLVATGKMIQRNGGFWFETVDEALKFLNTQA